MKVALVIVAIIAIIAVIIAASASLVCIIKLQEHEDKIADLETKMINHSEAGRLQNKRIRDIEQIINKKK